VYCGLLGGHLVTNGWQMIRSILKQTTIGLQEADELTQLRGKKYRSYLYGSAYTPLLQSFSL
jgi:hypothetical protein